MFGSNTNKGGGVEQRKKTLELGGDRMERTSLMRRRGYFYDNIKLWEMPFRSKFLHILMLVFYFLECFRAALRFYNYKG